MEYSGELKCDYMLIITWDQEGTIEKEGKTIRVVPFYKWCRDYWYEKKEQQKTSHQTSVF